MIDILFLYKKKIFHSLLVHENGFTVFEKYQKCLKPNFSLNEKKLRPLEATEATEAIEGQWGH